MRVVLGVSGASGAALALACARHLARLGARIDLVLSPMAERTLDTEVGPDAVGEMEAIAARRHDIRDMGATLASGSMRSLAAIAHGLDDNLLTRAAGVQLKERRPLVLLAREAPLTLAHLRNMTAATEMGAVILPPVPAFYLRPNSVDDIVTQIAARAVDLLRLGPPVAAAWDGKS